MSGVCNGRVPPTLASMRSSRAGWLSTIFLLTAAGCLIVWPGIAAIRGMIGAAVWPGPLPWRELTTSIGTAALVAVLGCSLAFPLALATRRGGLLSALAVIPVLVPAYLAYSGWGTVRDPTTWLGARLGSGPAWMAVLVGRVMAVGGLSLWAAPIAWLILHPAVRSLDPAMAELLRLEPCAAWRRLLVTLATLWRPIAGACALIGALMVGSSVPLHLAQFNTLAIRVWARLDEVPFDRRWEAALTAWPLMLPALLIAAVWFVRPRLVVGGGDPPSSRAPRAGRVATSAGWLVWACAAPIPLILMLGSIQSPHRLVTFWQESGQPFLSSAMIAAAVGGLGCLIAVAALRASGAGRLPRTVARSVGAGLLATGLLPGILVGLAYSPLAADASHEGFVVLAHLSRYGFIAVLAGWWLAVREDPDLRSMRWMDAADGPRAWAGLVLRPRLGSVGGVFVVLAALSLHEIEATVIVEPPGRGAFAREMLSFLHFFRMEQLATGMAYLGILSALAGLVATLLVRRGLGTVEP